MCRMLGLALAATVFGTACSGGVDRASGALGGGEATPSSAVVSTSARAVPSESGTHGPPSAAGEPVVVESPRTGDEVLSPVVVRGRAVSAGGRVGVRVLGADGSEIAAMNVDVSCGAACQGVFRAELAFFVPARQAGTVQVYGWGSNGTAEHLVEIPVTLVPGV
jgi:Immunoglobulin-like domain of bacterial spore germination